MKNYDTYIIEELINLIKVILGLQAIIFIAWITQFIANLTTIIQLPKIKRYLKGLYQDKFGYDKENIIENEINYKIEKNNEEREEKEEEKRKQEIEEIKQMFRTIPKKEMIILTILFILIIFLIFKNI